MSRFVIAKYSYSRNVLVGHLFKMKNFQKWVEISFKSFNTYTRNMTLTIENKRLIDNCTGFSF